MGKSFSFNEAPSTLNPSLYEDVFVLSNDLPFNFRDEMLIEKQTDVES